MEMRYRAYSFLGRVLSVGPVIGGKAIFDAGPDDVVDSVVFYAGAGEDEAVIGSVRVASSGAISADAPDA